MADGALAAELGRLLLERGWRMATAESCTGGLVAAALTDIAGSSAWFDRGFVTYSDDAKHQMLGVSPALIATWGAVSEPVAAAMADGARLRSSAQCAVSITGIAGPGGGSAEKPVGTVCFAWRAAGAATVAETRRFGGDRAAVRAAAVRHALEGLTAVVARA